MSDKILIADDDPDIRRILRRLLGKDYRVIEAADGRQALEAARKESPRLAFLDVCMPGMSGIEVLEAASRLGAAPTIVMLTSAADIELAQRALDLGASEYVTKPFDSEGLLGRVRRLMGPAAGGAESRPGRPWRIAGEGDGA